MNNANTPWWKARLRQIRAGLISGLRAWPVAGALALAATRASATEIWTGPAISFTEPIGADGSLPADQDRITPHVWLTRGLTMGVFNAEQESSYTHFYSPADTEWAYGELANYASLAYTNWETWNGSHPPNMVGQDAVLHLISDDIYIAVQFTSWTVNGGGFSYVRSTAPPPPAPAFQGIAVSGGSVSLTWSAATNDVYQLQFKTDLASTNWVNVGGPVTATNTSLTALDTNALALSSQRFYRVVLSH